jgi:uncharacterized protein YdaU (DUF1376 family)
LKTSPSFQFYPADFLGGTLLMSAEEVGAYIRLLCYQWQQGSCPDDLEDLGKIAGVAGAKLQKRVLKKFIEADGELKNERLECLRDDLENFRVLAKKGGDASGAKRTGNSEWGKEMAAKRQRTASLSFNEPDNEPDNEHTPTKRTNSQSQSQSQSHNEPSPASLREGVRARPTLPQAKQAASQLAITDAEAESWWLAREASEWTRSSNGSTTPVGTNWQADLRSYVNSARERAATEAARQAQRSNGYGKPPPAKRDPSQVLDLPK